jgi:hypothetical protein
MKIVRWIVISGASVLFMTSQLPAQVLVADCGELHPFPGGCSDPTCQSCVCGIDESCCGGGVISFGWDSVCVDIGKEPLQCLVDCVQEQQAIDTDGDGVPDDDDACADSDVGATVVIDGCDSGVANTVGDDGCTVADLVEPCADGVRNHGAYVRCVSHVTNDLKAAGELTGEEKDALQSCAGQADIP